MNERSNLICKLLESVDARTAYIKAKLGVLIPSQIRALRLGSEMPRQSDLATAAGLHQSRISMFETPGAANMTIETLARLAATFRVGLVVKFVPVSEMIAWESRFSQDAFDVVKIEADQEFLVPTPEWVSPIGSLAMSTDGSQTMSVVSAGSADFNDSSFRELGSIASKDRKGASAA